MKVNSVEKFTREKYLSCDIKPLQIEVAKNVAFLKNLKNVKNVQLFNSLSYLSVNLEKIEIIVEELEKLAREYDLSEDVHGNGFWTFIVNFSAAIRIVKKICKKITENRSNYFFSTNSYNK
jgi:Hormone-sensitive lipase (HSL) N-terminus